MQPCITPFVVDHCGKATIAEPFRRIAAALVQRHALEADPEEILFVLDRVNRRLRRSGSEIRPISPLWMDVLFQLTGRRFRYVIQLYEANLDTLSSEQVTALLYHELRHIRRDEFGATYLHHEHDMEDWGELTPYGDWEVRGGALPDLMATSPVEFSALGDEKKEA